MQPYLSRALDISPAGLPRLFLDTPTLVALPTELVYLSLTC